MNTDHEAFAALYKDGRRPTVDELLAADEAGPNLLKLNRPPEPTVSQRKAEFNRLRRETGLPLPALARLFGKPLGTVKAWAVSGRPDCVPPAEVIGMMEQHALNVAIDIVRRNRMDVIPRRDFAEAA
jgi:hypothetical protein